MKNLFNLSKSQIIIVLIVLLFCIFAVILTAYASFQTTSTSHAEAKVGDIILITDVQACEPEGNNKNPYCLVTVKNFNSSGEISKVATSYELIVESKDGTQLPEYTWSIESGNCTGEVTGEFGVSSEEQNVHRITFVNPGDRDFQKAIRIKANVVQR